MSTTPNALFAACGPSRLTENGDATNASAGDARVDFFYNIHDDASRESIVDHLAAAWGVDATDALRLVFYLLDVRAGKGSTTPALHCLQWLHDHHPATLLANLQYIRQFGCIRDYATLLMMIRADPAALADWRQKSRNCQRDHYNCSPFYKTLRSVALSDTDRKLHSAIVDLFATALVADKAQMDDAQPVSLHAKWLPTQDSYLNRATRLYDDVALAVYSLDRQTNGQQHTRRPLLHARNHLRRKYVSPLRQYSKVTERLMSDGEWTNIRYSGVPSKCMSRNAAHFQRHDPSGWQNFLNDATTGTTQVHAGTLKPHEILFPSKKTRGLSDELASAQWQSYVAGLRKSGSLASAIALCDVSGSMQGQPLCIAIALGTLIATVTTPPWQDHLITFSQDPQFHLIQGATLAERVRSIKAMNWESNTDFDRVFDHILQRAQRHSVKADEMPRTLFVLSDMQFDQADPTMTMTAFERIDAKYAAAGYSRPQIVFWNLRASSGVPVRSLQRGLHW